MEVSVIVKRGKEDKGKTYLLKEDGKSKKGTYKTFSPAQETEDLPAFGKLYVKATRNGKASSSK